jgi:MFS transporter, ACS family, D-galactonate transporter
MDKLNNGNSPTNVRWVMLALLMAHSGMCHFNRSSMPVAGAEHIIRERGLSETEMGFVYSTLLVVYTLCMIPGGWFIDRFGPKKALMFLGFGSALAVPLTGLTGFMAGASILGPLIIARGILGVACAPTHPGAARAVSFWMPIGSWGVANGLVTGAAVVGEGATFFIFGFLMDQFGWPDAFVIAGLVTLLVTIFWSFYATDHPSEHRGVNPAERVLIAEGNVAHTTSRTSLPYESGASAAEVWLLLGNRNLILLTSSYAALSYLQYLVFNWLQYYFVDTLKVSNYHSRLYSTIVLATMAVGMTSGGRIADLIQTRIGGNLGRRLTPFCGMVASALLFALGVASDNPTMIVALFALSMGALGMAESSFWVTGVELGGKRGGLSGAILNTGGNAVGFLAPVVTPYFSSFFGWRAGLVLASTICLLGAFLWWGIEGRAKEEEQNLTREG